MLAICRIYEKIMAKFKHSLKRMIISVKIGKSDSMLGRVDTR